MNLLNKVTLISLISSTLLFNCAKKESPTGPTINNNPTIEQILVSPSTEIYSGEDAHLECIATDIDNDPLSYNWSCNGGTLNQNVGDDVIWNSPSGLAEDLEYIITVGVNDNQGGSASDNVSINVMTRYDTISVSYDAYVSEFSPAWCPHQSEWNKYWVFYKQDNYDLEDYAKYELGAPKSVGSSKLELVFDNNWSNGESLYIDMHKVLEDWEDNNLTWENKPSYELTPSQRFTFNEVPNHTFVYFEGEGLTELVNFWMSNPDENYGLMLKPVEDYNEKEFISKEGAEYFSQPSWTPKLILEYE